MDVRTLPLRRAADIVKDGGLGLGLGQSALLEGGAHAEGTLRQSSHPWKCHLGFTLVPFSSSPLSFFHSLNQFPESPWIFPKGAGLG